MLGLALHLGERLALREQVRVQIGSRLYATKVRSPDPVCGVERSTQHGTEVDMSSPMGGRWRESVVGPGLVSLQPAFFDQFIAELAEAKRGLVVTEPRPGEQPSHT